MQRQYGLLTKKSMKYVLVALVVMTHSFLVSYTPLPHSATQKNTWQVSGAHYKTWKKILVVHERSLFLLHPSYRSP